MLCAGLYMSQNVKTYERSLTKIDSVLSYVGGLFGIVGIVLLFILAKYN
jgi:hypothetical protein